MKRSGVGLMVAGIIAASATGVYAAPAKLKVENGRTVAFEYVLKVDGQEIESSKGRAPLTFVKGAGQIVPGLDKQLTGMKAGDKKTVTVVPAEAYGMVNPQAFREVPIASLPKGVQPKPGLLLSATNAQGQMVPVKVAQVKKDSVVLDLNHPLAGKTLVFEVKIVSVQ